MAYIDRPEEAAKLKLLLESPACGFFYFCTGPPGGGKTTLIQRVCHEAGTLVYSIYMQFSGLWGFESLCTHSTLSNNRCDAGLMGRLPCTLYLQAQYTLAASISRLFLDRSWMLLMY